MGLEYNVYNPEATDHKTGIITLASLGKKRRCKMFTTSEHGLWMNNFWNKVSVKIDLEVDDYALDFQNSLRKSLLTV